MLEIEELAWEKMNGLLPVIVQHAQTGQVLMLGYMDHSALLETIRKKTIYFYSRSKERLWQKGESSGHYLNLVSIIPDCDNDSLLVLALPEGPTCHNGTASCFKETCFDLQVLSLIENIIAKRKQQPKKESYVCSLFDKGLNRIAQKVGEEAVEVIIAAMNESQEDFCNEMADLLFHIQMLLAAKELNLAAITHVLRERFQSH
jgi:phosphoribosyl-AMP cyclohydrolase / phosphoribosyl-ATP pyrophosphohydrolase